MTCYYVWLHSSSGDVGERAYIEAASEEDAIEQFLAELHDAGLSEPLDIRARPTSPAALLPA